MRRVDKYPDTDVFHFHNENPKNKFTDDCTIRAIGRATGKGWFCVKAGLSEAAMKNCLMDTDIKCVEKYLESEGWKKQKQPRKVDNTKYTGREFCKKLQKEDNTKNIIANIGGHHIVAIADNKVNDIWDSTYKTIGNYWVKI